MAAAGPKDGACPLDILGADSEGHETAMRFASATGHAAGVGRLENSAAIVRDEAGTYVEAGGATIAIRPRVAEEAATRSVN